MLPTVKGEDPYRRDFCEQADILFFSAVNQADPTPMIEAFLAREPEQIVVPGMGAQDGIAFYPPVEMEAPVIGTNGAGDSLAVGFGASHVLDGYSLRDSVLRGRTAARHTCTLTASSSHLITAGLLEREFQRRRT
jgi:sugar/nucleoside kinase (ribokinase family)